MQSKGNDNGVTYALVGSSGSGKTTMLREIFLDRLYSPKLADKDYIVTVFTESKESDALQGLHKDILIDGKGFDEDQFNYYYLENSIHNKKFNFVAVLDDCIHIRFRKTIERMFLVMRNTNITSIVSLQYPKLIPVSIRTSIYYCFCLALNNEEGIEIAVRTWVGSYIPGKNIREKICSYREWTQDHACYLLDNLEKKCYKVDKHFMCEEIPLVKPEDSDGTLLKSGAKRKRVKEEEESEYETSDESQEERGSGSDSSGGDYDEEKD